MIFLNSRMVLFLFFRYRIVNIIIFKLQLPVVYKIAERDVNDNKYKLDIKRL